MSISMQNVWLKEHNRIAGGIRDALARIRGGGFGRDPRRDDEFIYQVIFVRGMYREPLKGHSQGW